ncbi:hypothetical protein AVEN_218112-1 [Araneus ventricosus]|uniref:Uncharacterized protein n=1 Tax=Araneus ventricosus TaxID=182803 RepID=A0A4Y2RGE3_ARAVE|nr:hypothetical protein AVEN_41332-1 [Araneus ventricosus]GBN74319.1 hypothetical protein AVEN_218112-1 [Araneus ventricosus]
MLWLRNMNRSYVSNLWLYSQPALFTRVKDVMAREHESKLWFHPLAVFLTSFIYKAPSWLKVKDVMAEEHETKLWFYLLPVFLASFIYHG